MFGWSTALASRLEAAEKRLDELEDSYRRVTELEDSYRRVTELEADWQDWLHKIRNVLARLNQRDRDQAPTEAPARPSNGIANPAARRLLGLKEE